MGKETKTKTFEYQPEGSGWMIPSLQPGATRTASTLDEASEFSVACWIDKTPDVTLEYDPETVLDLTDEQIKSAMVAQQERNEAAQVSAKARAALAVRVAKQAEKNARETTVEANAEINSA